MPIHRRCKKTNIIRIIAIPLILIFSACALNQPNHKDFSVVAVAGRIDLRLAEDDDGAQLIRY